MKRHVWTADEDALVREHYRPGRGRPKADTQRWTAAALGRTIGVSERSIYCRALLLGVVKPQTRILRDAVLHALVVCRHGEGWLDGEIAAEWTGAHPDRPIARRTVCDVRRGLGLPSNRDNARHRQQVRERTAQQLQAAGARSLADLRSRAYAEFADDRGWPAYLRVRHVQVLELLYESGPQTREQISVAIGYRIERGQRYWLSSKYGHGSYLSDLLAIGLVQRSRRREAKLGGRGKSVFRYFVPVSVRRFDPATWPDEEWARGEIVGKKSELRVSGPGSVAAARGANVSGASAGGGGGLRVGSGRRGCRPQHRRAC